MSTCIWDILKIFHVLSFLLLPTIDGSDLSTSADEVSFIVSGLYGSDTSQGGGSTTLKVGDFEQYMESLRFSKVELPKIRKVQINMNQFVEKQGVSVEFKSLPGDMYLTVAKDGGIGDSKKVGGFKLFCSVHRCQPGVVVLSKTKLTTSKEVSRGDIIGAFYLEFYSNVPYIARTIRSEKARPYIYVCPGQDWNYGSNDFSYEIHSDAEYWQGKYKDDSSGRKNYPQPWKDMTREYGSAYPVPVIEGKEGENLMICGTLRRKINGEVVLKWGYKINYNGSEGGGQISNVTINGKDLATEQIKCDTDTVSVEYFKIGYLPGSERKDDSGKFFDEPTRTLSNIFYKYRVLFYRKRDLEDNLTMTTSYYYKNEAREPRCVNEYTVYPKNITTKLALSPTESFNKLKKHKVNGEEINMFEIGKDDHKFHIYCKVESKYTGGSLTDGVKLMFENFYKPHFNMGIQKIEVQGNETKNTGKFIPNGFLYNNKSSFDIYGMYRCGVENYDKYKELINEKPEHFLILPKNGLIVELDVDVSKNGLFNKQCYFELGSVGKLQSITMEHGKKQVSASVDKLQGNEYFEVISSGKKHVQLRGDLQKGDVLKCQYRTDYDIVFYTQVSFEHNDDFANSEAAKDKIQRNVVLFVTIAVVSFLLIVILTVVAFIVIRKKRRKRLESMSEYSGSTSKVSGLSKGSYSRSVSKSGTKSGTRSNTKSRSKSGSKGGSKSGSRSGSRSGSKSGTTSGTTRSKSSTFNTRSSNLVHLTAINN